MTLYQISADVRSIAIFSDAFKDLVLHDTVMTTCRKVLRRTDGRTDEQTDIQTHTHTRTEITDSQIRVCHKDNKGAGVLCLPLGRDQF